MMHRHSRRCVSLFVLLTGTFALTSPSIGVASTPPIKEIVNSRIGWEADELTKGPVCSTTSGDKCKTAVLSSEAGGFSGVFGVAGGRAPEGHVYAVDSNNHRVQELAADGQFIAMFGKEVNTNKTNICLAGETCKAGVESATAGLFALPQSIAVDPTNDDFYVAEQVSGTERVQKFTAAGQFVFEIGKEVNETTKGNFCAQTEIAKCKGPGNSAAHEPGAFAFAPSQGNILAVGGPEDHLYVGDEHTVQEFRPDGTWTGEPLIKTEAIESGLSSIASSPASAVTSIAVGKTGTIYLGYSVGCGCNPPETIREFDQVGKEIKEFPLVGKAVLLGLAIDGAGRLAAVESDSGVPHYYLYEVVAGKLHLLTEIASVVMIDDVAFNGNDELYGAGSNVREMVGYGPVPVAELLTGDIACTQGGVNGTSVTLDCILNGEVDPWGVAQTEVWFEWGKSASLGEKTPAQPAPNEQGSEGVEETPNPPCVEHVGEHNVRHEAKCPEVAISGVRPHDPLFYRLAAYDHYVIAPELLTSEVAVARAPAVPPRVLGEPNVAFIKSASAVMSGKLNPENVDTQYEFQFGPCEKNEQVNCATSPYAAETTGGDSAAYSAVNVILEATGLQPDTWYHYRVAATNEEGQHAVDENGGSEILEGDFKTALAPAPQASTEPVNAIGTTSAKIAGAVNPDGQLSTYSFEMGLDKGGATQYERVSTGSAGAGTTFVGENFVLTGLQPGTRYAYRIMIKSGFGAAVGATVTFSTAGLPVVLPPPEALALLPVPPIHFPHIEAPKPKLTRAELLARALKVCKKKPKRQRPGCARKARSKFAVAKGRNKRK